MPEANGQAGCALALLGLVHPDVVGVEASVHLPSRSLEGFGGSLMRLMGLDLPIPDHTHLSRRARVLVVQIPRQERTGPIPVVVDSTGLKVFGEGGMDGAPTRCREAAHLDQGSSGGRYPRQGRH